MRIESSNSALINLRNLPRVTEGQSDALEAPKTLGDTPPQLAHLEENTALAALFAKSGRVSKLARRLNRLKNKNCKVLPALGTIACIDDNDLVYLGVPFLKNIFENHPSEAEAILAGIMAHEWGHACAEKPKPEELAEMSWDQIFAERRAHEAFADETSGRLLALLDYPVNPLINFLSSLPDSQNLKYDEVSIRISNIRQGFNQEIRKKSLAKDLFKNTTYPNHYTSTLIDDDL